jgi:enterochelin esterase-like enzyme
MRLKMKAGERYLFLSILFSLLLLTGCEDNSKTAPVPSTAPSETRLEKSTTVRFIDSLKQLPLIRRPSFLQKFLSAHPVSPFIEDSSLALIFYIGTDSVVLINADMQAGWTTPDTLNKIECGNENFFYKFYSLPPDARVDYLFLINNKTLTDPLNPVKVPSGFGEHSQLAMPLFKPDPLRNYNADISHGSIDSLLFESPDNKRQVKIYISAGYDSLQELPVIYFNDGIKALEYCNFKNILDNLIAEKKIKPVISVFIGYSVNDYSTFPDAGEGYTKFICDKLVPFVDTNYKTSQTEENRISMGVSAGANYAFLTALNRPDKFLNAAGQSTTVSTFLLDAIDNISSNADLKKNYKFCAAVGRYDLYNGTIDGHTFLSANQKLDNEMNKLNIRHSFNIYNGGHQWGNWRENVSAILIYFFGIK